MSQDVYCVARTDDQAQEIIEKIQKMGIGPDSFTVVAKPEEVDRTAYRASEEARNAANGAVGGTIIGLLFGGAVLSTMGFAGIPGLFEAILLLACAALGGAMFGAIAGSTGLFAKKRIPTPLERHFEEEISEGGVLLSIQVGSVAERDRLIGTMNALGVADVHYAGEQAA